jgi:hypothetical protein
MSVLFPKIETIEALPETITAFLPRNCCVTEFGVLTHFSVFGVSYFQ